MGRPSLQQLVSPTPTRDQDRLLEPVSGSPDQIRSRASLNPDYIPPYRTIVRSLETVEQVSCFRIQILSFRPARYQETVSCIAKVVNFSRVV